MGLTVDRQGSLYRWLFCTNSAGIDTCDFALRYVKVVGQDIQYFGDTSCVLILLAGTASKCFVENR